MTSANQRPVRWGILATGKIASQMVRDAAFTSNTEIFAVGSRSHDSAQRFADTFGIKHVYGSYNALLADDRIDLIYIATPHNSHFDLIKCCLEAGKHVLCEKPMVLNALQARECAELARAKNLFLMEAMWTRFFPAIQQALQWIEEGEIGTLQKIEADFSFKADFDPQGRLFDPALAGGALLDIGIYPIALATLFFGKPEQVLGSALLGQTGVDEEDQITLSFAGGAEASLRCGVRENRPVAALIEGARGRLAIHERFHQPSRLTRHLRNGEPQTFEFPFEGMGYHYQIAAVSEAVQQGLTEHPLMPLSATIQNLEVMDTLRQQWNLRYPDE